MADTVKWIKITTDMFDDEKIDFITSLPESDAIIVIWIRLLSLAGKCNAGGYVYLTEKIPYTDDMLSHKFRKPITIIKLALNTLQKLGMIEYDDGVIFLTNWAKHQNVEGLEKIRERDKERKRKERASKKQLLIDGEMSQDSHRTVVGRPQTDIDKDKDKEIDIDKEIDKEISSCRANKFADDAIELALASELYNLMLVNNPKARKPNLQTWSGYIDLMIRVDKRSAFEIQEVTRWCQKDSFWQANILSTKKLREKYDQLTMKMKSVIKQVDKHQLNRPKSFDAIDQWYDMTKGMEGNDTG